MRRNLIFCILMCLVLASVPTLAQDIGDPPLPVVRSAADDHPRILITAAYIDNVLRPRAEQDGLAWRHFENYVRSNAPENDLHEHPEQVMRSLAIAYYVTGEPEFANRAQIALLAMVQEVANHPAMTSGGTWDIEFADQVAGVALGYDWLYATLRETDKQELRKILIDAVTLLNDPWRDTARIYYPTDTGTFRFAAYDHDGARVIWAVTAVGMALLGEDFRAADFIDYARNIFTGWIIPALEDQTGGAWAEGSTSGFRGGWAAVQTATAFWTVNGENFFDDTGWWYDRMPYDMFLYQPEVQRIEADSPAFWRYPAVFGDTISQSNIALMGRAQDMLLSTIFAGTEQAAWMEWFLAQGNGEVMAQRWMAVEEFLWRDETATGFPPPWLFWYAINTDHLLMRSAWIDDANALDPSATTITFNAGDHFASHQFFDQGNFTIWRAGDDLIVRGGSDSGEGDFAANYYGRTAAGNTILVCDLAENFDNIRPNPDRDFWLNDCGQRPVFPTNSTAINPYYRADHQAGYETGTILRYAEEGSINYFRADLTPAYNSTRVTSPNNRPKVEEVQRELVYIRPGTLVVYDRVQTTQPDFTTISQLHTQFAPTQQANWITVTGENSRLQLAQIVPTTTINITQGYEVAGEILTPVNIEPTHTIQFVSTQNGTTHYFLTLLIADALSAAPVEDWLYVDGESVLGVAWADWQIMFDDDPGNLSSATFEIAPNIENVLVIGLQPFGAYRLQLPDNTQTDLLADSAGTLYIFNELSGTVRLSQR